MPPAATPSRWTLPDLPAALSRALARRKEGIRCSLAVLGEHAKDSAAAFTATKDNISLVRGIAGKQLDSAVSVKLTALGAAFDEDLSLENLHLVAAESARNAVPLEIDMEGKGLVDLTIGAAIAAAKEHDAVTVTLQAYLDRTAADIRTVSSRGIGVRLVKGAYLGDTADFTVIQERFRTLASVLADGGRPFPAGTHDPDLIAWLQERMADRKEMFEFGFLMGLSAATKARLVSGGWAVSEYVPFGAAAGPYVARRERYLRELEAAGRNPAP